MKKPAPKQPDFSPPQCAEKYPLFSTSSRRQESIGFIGFREADFDKVFPYSRR
jgi:hypothetical protein